MNITIEKATLLQTISKLVNLTERRTLMPVLSNVLIDFSEEGIKIYSTDLELSAKGYIKQKIDIDEDKRILIHGKRFQGILKEIEDGPVELIIKENTIDIRQKGTKFTLSLINPEDFPEIRFLDKDKGFSIKGESLLSMIDKVGFAVSTDINKGALTGMFMKGLTDRIIVAATDRFRMALYRMDIPNIEGFNRIIIPKRTLIELQNMIDKEDDVNIVVEDKDIQFDTGKIILISRIIEGNYPNPERMIPANNPNIAIIERERLIKGLRKILSILERSEPIKVIFDGKEKKMDLEAESGIGMAKDTITEIDYSGKDLMYYFNIRYIMEVITHMNGEKVVIRLPDTRGAVLFEEEGSNDYKNIIMPVRMEDEDDEDI